MRRALGIFAFVAAVLAVPSHPGAAQQLPKADQVVTPRVYLSLEPVPRGRSFEIAVVAAIQPGFHINANPTSEDYLIPTTLTPAAVPGLKLSDARYPRGVLRKFKFTKRELSVYEGSVTLRLKVEAENDAALGALKLPLTLRYQACNEEACLPPVKLPLTAEFEIAPAGANARATHPEIFTIAAPRKK